LEWDWTKEEGVTGYWSLRDLESGCAARNPLEDGDVSVVPPGTLPVFGLGEKEL
jgi:hypothetical protein